MILPSKHGFGNGPQAGAQGISISRTPTVHTFVNNIGLQGFQGSELLGIQGIPGDGGFTGVFGLQGNQGSQGSQGIQGIQGIDINNFNGIIGNKGFAGNQGSQGSQGLFGFTNTGVVQGVQGSQGLQSTEPGFLGSQGNQGSTSIFFGPQGSQGNQGSQGSQSLGIQGYQNAYGVQGSQGSQGWQGRSISGNQGFIGPIAGVMGSQGLIGQQGFTISGYVGIQGAQGVQNSIYDISKSSEFFDDFIGQSVDAMFTPVVNTQYSIDITAKQGVLRMVNGPTDNSILSIGSYGVRNPQGSMFETAISPLSVNDSTIYYIGYIYYHDTITRSGIYFRCAHNSPIELYHVKYGSSYQVYSTDKIISVSDGTTHNFTNFRIDYDRDVYNCYIDNVLYHTINTSRGAFEHLSSPVVEVNGANSVCYVDYYHIKYIRRL